MKKKKAKTHKRGSGKVSRTAQGESDKASGDQYFGRLKVESFSKLTGGNMAVYATVIQR